MSASRCLPTPAALSPAENGRHHRRGREAPPRPAPRGATAAAVRGLRAPPATSRATGPVLPGTRVARPRRGPARRRGGRGGGRDRVLAGELLHVAGALRALRAGAVVAHQALRQVQDKIQQRWLSYMPNWWMQIVQKTFVKEGAQSMAPNQVAGEILSFFTRNNFTVSDRGEVITFEGTMVPSRGQAALLTFCTCISLGSVGLVLSIAVPEGGNNWFWLMTLSPLAGVYYWTKASRKEEIKVKMILSDDGNVSEILVQGDDVQVEQMRKELTFSEKGMIYVKGIFET